MPKKKKGKRAWMLEFLKNYRGITGQSDVDMMQVAKAAEKAGYKMPKPMSPLERLAHQFAEVARAQLGQGDGYTYRVNQAFEEERGGQQLMLWGELENLSRPNMKKVMDRREKLIAGAVTQLTLDLEHWNGANPTEKPLRGVLDFRRIAADARKNAKKA